MSCVQFELVAPRPDLRKRLRPAFVTELSRLRADDLPHDLPGNAEVSAYRLDRLTVDEVGATDLRNRLHDQHSNLGSHENGSQCGPSVPGSRLDADHPESGVLIPCRNTASWANRERVAIRIDYPSMLLGNADAVGLVPLRSDSGYN